MAAKRKHVQQGVRASQLYARSALFSHKDGSDGELRDATVLSDDSVSTGKSALRRREFLDLTAERCMVLVNAHGDAHQVQGSRVDIAERFGISQRDLRLVDPWVPVPFPGAFMVREQAILANLGSVRAVISRKECLVLSVGRDDEEYIITEEPDVSDGLVEALCKSAQSKAGDVTKQLHAVDVSNIPDIMSMPFELRMLETCLDEAAELLSIEVGGVFHSGMSRIKVLRQHGEAGGDVLEELKAIRAEAVALRSRVKNFKNELEDMLKDDQDMLDMYLQRRHDATIAAAQPASAPLTRTMPSLATSHKAPSATSLPAPLPSAASAEVLPASQHYQPPATSVGSRGQQQQQQQQQQAISVECGGATSMQAGSRSQAGIRSTGSGVPEDYKQPMTLSEALRSADTIHARSKHVGGTEAERDQREAGRPSLQGRIGPAELQELAEKATPGTRSGPPQQLQQQVSTGSGGGQDVLMRNRSRRSTRVGQHGWERARFAEQRAAADGPDGGKGGFAAVARAAMLQFAQRSSAPLSREGVSRSLSNISEHTARTFDSSTAVIPLHQLPAAADHVVERLREHTRQLGSGQIPASPPPSTFQPPSANGPHGSFTDRVGHAHSAHAAHSTSRVSTVPEGTERPEDDDDNDDAPEELHQTSSSSSSSSSSGSSSGSKSTLIMNHLLELKHQHAQDVINRQREGKGVDPHEIQDVENMLEAFCLQADYFLFQLGELDEEIDDFQEDLTVALAKKRNAIFALQLLITIITMAFSFVSMIGGIFGMNLTNHHENDAGWWAWTTGLSTGIALATAIALIALLRYNRMLFLGSD